MINVHLVLGSTERDSRVLKETASIGASGLFAGVEVLGLSDEEATVFRSAGPVSTREFALRTRRLPRNLAGQAIKFGEWRRKVLAACRHRPLGVVHCHDLLPLPVAVKVKRSTGARLVYDAHELETERAGLHGLRRRIAERTERRLMRHVDALVTVSPSIAARYRARHPGTEVVLVRNVPERPDSAIPAEDLRGRLGVPDEALLFVSVGAFVKGRGIGQTLEAFADPTVRHHVVFMGFGGLADRIDAAAAACPRIHRIAPVPPREVLRHVAGADVGLSLIEDICLSYRFCLPNKLFECLVAGVPVLCSDLPDQAELVARHRCGWTVEPSREALVGRLAAITVDEARAMRSELPDRVAELTWDRESEHLLALYRRLLGRTS